MAEKTGLSAVLNRIGLFTKVYEIVSMYQLVGSTLMKYMEERCAKQGAIAVRDELAA